MKPVIHPHEGYLNTKYSFFLPKSYSEQEIIVKQQGNDHPYSRLRIVPGATININFNSPGKYEMIDSDGDVIAIVSIEDGYKFGGSKIKQAYLFEDIPWVIIVMFDRTYFHNRDNCRGYVESISPDMIKVISETDILLSNNDSDQTTVYSLQEERPIITKDNVIYADNNYIMWKELRYDYPPFSDNNVSFNCLNIQKYSESISIDVYSCKDYLLLNDCGIVAICDWEGKVFCIDVANNSTIVRVNIEGQFITFLKSGYVVTLIKDDAIRLYDLRNGNVSLFQSPRFIESVNKITVNNVPDDVALFGGYYSLTIASEHIALCTLHTRHFKDIYHNVDSRSFTTEYIKSCFKKEYLKFCIENDNIVCRVVVDNALAEELDYFRFHRHDEFSKEIRITMSKEMADDLSANKEFKPLPMEIRGFIDNDGLIDNLILLYVEYEERKEYGIIDSEGRILEHTTSFPSPARIIEKESLVCIVFGNTIFVDSRLSGLYEKYNNVVHVYESQNSIYVLQKTGVYYTLGFIDDTGALKGIDGLLPFRENEYSFSFLRCYDTIEDDKHQLINVANHMARTLGKFKCCIDIEGFKLLQSDSVSVYEGGYVVRSSFKYHSEDNNFGLVVDNKKLLLYKKQAYSEGYTCENILNDIYISSEYHDVLFSEDGHQMLSNNANSTIITDVETGRQLFFNRQKYVMHINGKRPYMEYNKCRKLRIINPLNGLEFDNKTLMESVFVSPHGKYYADTRLEEYKYYFNRIENKEISIDEYNGLINRFCSIEERKYFIKCNSNYFKNNSYPGPDPLTSSSNEFVSLFIQEKGRIILRFMSDNTISHVIEIGQPLWFLNYVAFSDDERCVAIAGKYRNRTGYNEKGERGGLLLLYDLIENKLLYNEQTIRAVWMVSFSKDGTVGAYTSDPNTILLKDNDPHISKQRLSDYSFLSFSVSGRYIALSKQGYVPYDSRGSWGHQHSSMVSLRSISNPEKELIQYTDLSNVGIDGICKASSVASVCFSADDKRLMMVSKDGVVVVRNIHL